MSKSAAPAKEAHKQPWAKVCVNCFELYESECADSRRCPDCRPLGGRKP